MVNIKFQCEVCKKEYDTPYNLGVFKLILVEPDWDIDGYKQIVTKEWQTKKMCKECVDKFRNHTKTLSVMVSYITEKYEPKIKKAEL
jgi:hypothetical protein